MIVKMVRRFRSVRAGESLAAERNNWGNSKIHSRNQESRQQATVLRCGKLFARHYTA